MDLEADVKRHKAMLQLYQTPPKTIETVVFACRLLQMSRGMATAESEIQTDEQLV